MANVFFDIETGPPPPTELALVLPPFDPDAVKAGNLKDPEKVAVKIKEAETSHGREFTEKAGLDPLTGRVLAVGLMSREESSPSSAMTTKRAFSGNVGRPVGVVEWSRPESHDRL